MILNKILNGQKECEISLMDFVNVSMYLPLDQSTGAVYKAVINMPLSFSLPWVSFTVHNMYPL